MKSKVLTILAASLTLVAAPAALAEQLNHETEVSEAAYGGYRETFQIGCDAWGPIFRTNIYDCYGCLVRWFTHR